MAATNFFTSLINLGISPQDATILETHYANEKGFTDDIDIVSSWLALKQIPTSSRPNSDPWQHIYDHILKETQAGIDIDSAFSNSLSGYASDIQIALTRVVSLRMKVIYDFEQSKGNKKRHKTIDYINQLKIFGHNFRLNVLDDSIELNGTKLSDVVAAEVRTQMRDAGFYKISELEDAYVTFAKQNSYHPIQEYLNSLKYDGGNYISEVASYFVDKYGMFDTWLRRWLIGACAKVFEAEQNRMLVLDGMQEIGKSEFIRWLASKMKHYHIESSIEPDNKDHQLRLANKWIWEVSEFGATTRKSDYEALKAFLTTRTITVRKPYGHHDIVKPAMCSFIGTINNSSGIFADPTGSRRFMVSHLLEIDYHGYLTIDVDNVWAEAMAAYLNGENWKLEGKERENSNEINEQYSIDNPIEDLIKKYFHVDKSHDDWWVSTIDILHVLENPNEGALKGTTQGNAMKLSSAMTKLGLEKVRGYNHSNQRVWGYKGLSFIKTVP